MKETKLNPRQSPQKPPKPEMKSNQVFFGDRLNSEWKLITKWHDIMIFSKYWIPMFFAKVYITEHRRVSKEDIHNGNILLIGIVWHLSLKKIGDDYFSKASLKDTRLDIRIETRWTNSIHDLISDIYLRHSDTVYCSRKGGRQRGNGWSRSFF